MTTTISKDVQARIQIAIGEQNAVFKERSEHIHLHWVAAIARRHLLMIAPGGTAKSMLIDDMVDRVTGAKLFKETLSETSDPADVVGPYHMKRVIDEGKMVRNVTDTLLDADYAFLDEFFNSNGPVLHKIMKPMNEREYDNGGEHMTLRLRSIFAASNKVNADIDLAALFDRMHLRVTVKYVQDRQNRIQLVRDAISRAQAKLIGAAEAAKTTVTLEEMDRASVESLGIEIPDAVEGMFHDIREELLGAKGIEISDRRMVDGIAVVLANAWVNGHDKVTTGDLGVLQYMWWTQLSQVDESRSIILSATNPGEKAALDLLDELDKLRADLKNTESQVELDQVKKNRAGIEIVRNCDKVLSEAKSLKETAAASGASTTRIDEVLDRAGNLQQEVGTKLFGLKETELASIGAASH